ncbi:unnamed protein product [Amoebophrya sp. A25]|nr:unnamed protein product [Amoebophrya sp. A25]|eukprot:GSA25T00024288001.1
MRAHEDAHLNGDIIKVSKIKKRARDSGLLGAIRNEYRPEHHAFNEKSGRHHSGPDALLCEIRVPDELWNDVHKTRITCKKCAKWQIDLCQKTLSLRQQSKRVDFYRSHVQKCKGKRKEE